MIVVDVETGGLDPRWNPLISIGAVNLDNPNDTFYGECRPMNGLELTDEALKVNGFTREYLNNIQATTEGLLRRFISWVKQTGTDCTIVGENPRFDLDFIVENLKRFGLDNPFGYRTVDLHSLVVLHQLRNGKDIPLKNNRSNISLDWSLKYFGIGEQPIPHNARDDARLEAELFNLLC